MPLVNIPKIWDLKIWTQVILSLNFIRKSVITHLNMIVKYVKGKIIQWLRYQVILTCLLLKYSVIPSSFWYTLYCINTKPFKIKMINRNFTRRFNVVMTSLSSDKKIMVQQCYICGERCDFSLSPYLFKQIVSHRWSPIVCSG